MKVQTRDLQPGDVLSSGETVVRRPTPEFHPMYGKNKMRVTLSNPNPNARYQVETRVWGKYTTIFITRPEKSIA